MAHTQSSLKYFLILFVLSSGVGFSQEKNPVKNSVEEVFTLIEAKTLGQKTQPLLHSATRARLKNYADSVLSKTTLSNTKNPLYVDNPDLHRMLCFLITSYVYASEAQSLPQETQVYVVDDSAKRDQILSVEIQNVQSLFDRCEKLELKLLPTGVVYFNWDTEEYLNGLPSEDKSMMAEVEIPEAFRKDPLLAQLFGAEVRYSKIDRNEGTFGNELTMILLEGVKNQIASGQPNIVKFATRVASKAGQKVLRKGWKERQALIASLTRDDTSLFGSSEIQKETARALTRLIALPGKSAMSEAFFTETVKNVLGSDLKLKVKMGREAIYAGFKIELK